MIYPKYNLFDSNPFNGYGNFLPYSWKKETKIRLGLPCHPAERKDFKRYNVIKK